MNYSAQVRFPRTGHSVDVELKFSGLDAFDYLKVEGSVRGTLPPVGPKGTEVTSEAFSEEFTRWGKKQIETKNCIIP
jgi:hypothetical protein